MDKKFPPPLFSKEGETKHHYSYFSKDGRDDSRRPMKEAIFLGLGANLSGPWGTPVQTMEMAINRLQEENLKIIASSTLWHSAPVPASDQPFYVNAVISVATSKDPLMLLALLQQIENEAGRIRMERNGARCLDIDLLAYGDLQYSGDNPDICLPHPRLAERAFVLLPWSEIAPDWQHPVSGLKIMEMIDIMPKGQIIRIDNNHTSFFKNQAQKS